MDNQTFVSTKHATLVTSATFQYQTIGLEVEFQWVCEKFLTKGNIFTTHQWSWGKLKFSVMCVYVCESDNMRQIHVTINQPQKLYWLYNSPAERHSSLLYMKSQL